MNQSIVVLRLKYAPWLDTFPDKAVELGWIRSSILVAYQNAAECPAQH